ncbi:M48 family metalloprotease [Halorussus aquaticus]|uniref:M48 family metalloprotease n=1 Tax=Halorussus aquaticus TaxID=2953748 RepID=A0ABD5Q239_9EURY|nr:M48 family metalloprotease [Halorussus aquaticus]
MTSIRLRSRLAVALLVVVSGTLAFVVGIVISTARVGEIVGPVLLVSPQTGAYAGTILGGVLAVGIVVGTTYTGTNAVHDRLESREIAETAYADDDIESLVERLALQLDVPMPAVELAETPVPHASVSGLTRRGSTLVLSSGLLDRLDRDQLAAVLAHELAHLANRDALVVTLVAVPAVFGRSVMDGLNATNESDGVPGALYTNLFGIAAFLLAGCLWLVGKSLLAVFTRQRELAADRAAARLVGSPATLADALDTLDPESIDAPVADVRRARAVGVFSIVEPPRPSRDAFTIWENRRRPPTVRVRDWFVATGDALFATHPPTEKRTELLRRYERE